MKKFTLSFRLMTLLLCSFLAVSCGDDDDDVAPLSNQLEYENTRYDLDLAFSVDYGPFGFIDDNETHYAQEFVLFDTIGSTQASRIALDLVLLSSGTSAFQTGTFDFADLSNETSASVVEGKYRDKNIFLESAFLKDVNNDGEFDENTETFMISGGTVKITGTAPTYVLDCDLVLEGGKTVKAQYAGEFINITDEIIDEDAKTNQRKAPSAIPFTLRAPKPFKAN
jgi:hypothetical protein